MRSQVPECRFDPARFRQTIGANAVNVLGHASDVPVFELRETKSTNRCSSVQVRVPIGNVAKGDELAQTRWFDECDLDRRGGSQFELEDAAPFESDRRLKV